MVKIKEINGKDLSTVEGFCRLFVEKKDAFKLRLMAKKYKIRRVILFKKMIEFFEVYYDILESRHFSLQKFLDERKDFDEVHKNEVQALINEKDALEENYKKVIAELNEFREKNGNKLSEEKGHTG